MKLFKSVTHSGGGYNNNKLELQSFKVSNKKRSVIVGTIIISVLLLSGIFLYNTFAVFTEEKHFNVINGTVSDPGDIYFAYYVDDEITRELPKKGSDYTLDTEKSNCTNGVVPSWDDDGWKFIGDFSNYNATDYTRTKCDLYFKAKPPTAAKYITTLAQTDTTNLAVDDYGNTRYIGKSPNNYVSVDGELWRIIGVMKSIDDGTGNKSDRVKLIRNESIGGYSWDTSKSSVNSGYGVNEWSHADLMKLLNPGYEENKDTNSSGTEITVNNSLYYNSSSGLCYWDSNNGTNVCNFTSTGIKDKLKTLIGDAVWNTGSQGTNSWTSASGGLTKHFYTYERSDNTGKICTSSNYCNDTVARTTTWKGKVGLMYPSDYGYATSGGSTTDRTTCLNTYLYNWSSSGVSDCKNNDWLLFGGNTQWILSPYASSLRAYNAFLVYSARIDSNFVHHSYDVRPVVYLSSNVGVQSGDGSSSNPFILGL